MKEGFLSNLPPHFPSEGKWGGLYSFVYPYRWSLIAGLLLVLLSSGTLLSFPYLAGQLLDVATATEQTDPYFGSIAEVLIAMLGVALAQGLFSYLRIYCMGWFTERVTMHLKERTYANLLALPLAFYDKHRVGDLLSRLEADSTLIQQSFSLSLTEGLRQISIISIGMLLIFSIAPQLSLLLLAILPLLLLLGMYFGRMLRRLSKERQTHQGQTSTAAEESLHLMRTIKAFTAEAWQVMRYREAQQLLFRSALRGMSRRAAFVGLLLLLMLGGVALLLAYGATLVQTGVLTTGNLLTFVLYTTFMGGSAATLGDIYGQWQKIKGAADRVRVLFSEKTEVQTLSQGTVPFRNGDLYIEKLYFSYPTRPEVEVLQNLSLHIPLGSRVAFVGPSGAGKSTLIQLLLRYYNPQKGQIRIGTQAIADFSLQGLRKEIAVVAQETILFGTSIAENIRYGCPEASEAELVAAAEAAYVMEFATQWPQGLHTRIGERGLQLSGGQRQRIAIARAILKNPAILVLDEATSALDSYAESYVQKALKHLMQHRTTLIIAHRLATIREVQRIYVLKAGKLMDSGTHTELLKAKESLYKELITAQALV